MEVEQSAIPEEKLLDRFIREVKADPKAREMLIYGLIHKKFPPPTEADDAETTMCALPKEESLVMQVIRELEADPNARKRLFDMVFIE